MLYWYQIGDKTYYVAKVSKFYVEKGYLYVNLYFADQNILKVLK